MTSFTEQWVRRYADHDQEITSWYPCQLDQIAAHARTRSPESWVPLNPDEIQEWRAFLAPFSPPEQLTHQLQRLADPRARVVITGQQAGLLGGPLYTIYKAIGAIRWARRLENELGSPVVPLFWVASDDHDFDEVARHSWLDAKGDAKQFAVEPNPDFFGRPMFECPIPAEQIELFADAFEQSTAPGEFRDEATAFIRSLTKLPELNFETQFIACLVRWLGEQGIVPVVPRMNWLRRRAQRVIKREIERAPNTSTTLIENAKRISNLGGRGAGLHRNGNEANFFVMRDERRCKVLVDEGRFQVIDPLESVTIEAFSRDEMLVLADRRPEVFSPNAALRPVVQDSALPTVAYIGGPSEIVYHAQIGSLYEQFEVFRPALVPRPSALLVEPRVARLLGKLNITAEETLRGGTDELQRAAAGTADQAGLRDQVERQIQQALNDCGALLEIVGEQSGDTGLRKAAERMQQSVEVGADKLRERLDQFLSRRNEDVARQSDRIAAAFWPQGAPQERVLGAFSPLLRTTGPGAFDMLMQSLREDECTDQIINLILK